MAAKTGRVLYAAPADRPLYTFSKITKNALSYTLNKLSLSYKKEDLDHLMNAYLELQTYEEVSKTLKNLNRRKVKQTIFSNGTKDMLTPLVKIRELSDFCNVLSIDDVKQYKPSPAAYKYAHESLGVNCDEILFMSSNF
jgi:2-haloacid dehalogenase